MAESVPVDGKSAGMSGDGEMSFFIHANLLVMMGPCPFGEGSSNDLHP